MKQPLWERFIWWLCGAFGHKRTSTREGNVEWFHNGMYHYTCLRCGRVVSRAATQPKD
jgi:hypothetical protein